jgi:hypothetical protein
MLSGYHEDSDDHDDDRDGAICVIQCGADMCDHHDGGLLTPVTRTRWHYNAVTVGSRDIRDPRSKLFDSPDMADGACLRVNCTSTST